MASRPQVTEGSSQRSVARATVAVRAVAVGAAVLALLAATAWARPAEAKAMNSYNCASPHCYAKYWWTPEGFKGAQVNIDVEPMGCTGCVDSQGHETSFVDNEMWLVQGSVTSCENSYSGEKPICWVEEGYTTYGTSSGESVWYFWADNRPGGGYHEYEFLQVPTGDYGLSTEFEIYSSGYHEFTVYMDGYTSGAYLNYSTGNSMSPTDIDMGQELYGTSGAWADNAFYRDRDYYDSNFNLQALPSLSGSSSADDQPPYLVVSGSDYYTWCC